MSSPKSVPAAPPPKAGSHAWLKGETGALIRSIDWPRHPMGPIEGWPQSLRTALSICLGSDFPMALWWGPEVWQLYNDGYIPVLGGKHPAAMGQHGNVCWAEIWDVVGPIYERVMRSGESSFFSDLLLVMERNRYVEETYFTFSYSPVLDEQGGVGGNLIICTETTDRVVGERRLRTLRDLGARAAEGKNAAEACAIAAETLAANPWDVPFACIYLLDSDGRFGLAGSAGVKAGCPVAIEVVEPDAQGWPFAEVIRTSRIASVDDLAGRFAEVPASPWEDPTRSALVLPLAAPGQERPTGVLAVGVNPRRALDESYRGFYELAASQIAAAVADARAYEEERRRAEALAELDRAKTAFFSNVSHELRTPLTLLLGPLEDALGDDGRSLPDAQRERLQTAHRNALRLLKLVNTLLDFARIEAGRIQAVYEPTDLPACTIELASVFRSAVERAGLRFTVDCPPLPGGPGGMSAYVDREMWEKIVLNLLSNALKFTLEGEIAVRLRPGEGGERLELSVADTGAGIPADELPRVFERFRRVRTARARSQEGTGIGLALVQELARLHGGEVRAESEPGRGTTFTVSIPAGPDHLPADRIGPVRTLSSTAVGAAPYVEEALRWLPGAAEQAEPPALSPAGTAPDSRILLVDDNADMREYVRRLLASWTVETAADGASALAAALASPPDLVLADVMMPGLDGFELLRALRSHPRTATVPVILLSARAGEEARVEGLQAGADDYLIKPFSARELVARVGAHLATARLREQVAARERAAREEAEAASRAKDEFLAMLSHELRNPIGAIASAAHALASLPGPGERLERLARIVSRQSAHLTGLLDDLLDVARVTAGKIELRRRPVDIAEIAERCRRTLEAGGRHGSHRLEVQAAPAWVDGDPTRLDQVLTNLVENALKYTPPGGSIRIEVGPEGDEAVLRVVDTGVGISPDVLPKIFDLFVQGERSLDRAEGGLGIGLTLVRRLVELHGGRVTARSGGRGQGSELEVRLPRLAAPREEGEAPARAGRSALRVLVIEDNPDAREALQMLLEIEGHEVVSAADGAAGVELAGRFHPDLVLLDIGLPGENGYEVARRLAALAGRSRMRLVALTGYGQENDRRLSREAGFDLHLVKPLELARLREVLAGL